MLYSKGPPRWGTREPHRGPSSWRNGVRYPSKAPRPDQNYQGEKKWGQEEGVKGQEEWVQGQAEGVQGGRGRVGIQGLDLDGDREEKRGVNHPTLQQPLDHHAKNPKPLVHLGPDGSP